jgi:hypothetical protein
MKIRAGRHGYSSQQELNSFQLHMQMDFYNRFFKMGQASSKQIIAEQGAILPGKNPDPAPVPA